MIHHSFSLAAGLFLALACAAIHVDVCAQSLPEIHSGTWVPDESKSDEFNGSSLDTSKWWKIDACAYTDSIRHGYNGEGAFYIPDHVSVSNGNLVLKIDYNPDSSDLSFPCTHYHLYPFYSGGVMSKLKNGGEGIGPAGSFSFGYYEMRARLPGYYDSSNHPVGYGFSPNFWFYYQYVVNHCVKKHDEVDILEPGQDQYYDARTNVVGWHDEEDSCQLYKVGQDSMRSANPLFDGYHTYAVELLPDRIAFYFDGQPFFSADTISSPEIVHSLNMSPLLTVVITLAAGGYHMPRPLPGAPFQEYMWIDYFRYYSFIPDPVSGNMLYQNSPDPFRGNTTIKCNIVDDARNCYIRVYNMPGVEIKSIPVSQKGISQITLDASELDPGMYIYSLCLDGRIVDSKRMIVLK